MSELRRYELIFTDRDEPISISEGVLGIGVPACYGTSPEEAAKTFMKCIAGADKRPWVMLDAITRRQVLSHNQGRKPERPAWGVLRFSAESNWEELQALEATLKAKAGDARGLGTNEDFMALLRVVTRLASSQAAILEALGGLSNE